LLREWVGDEKDLSDLPWGETSWREWGLSRVEQEDEGEASSSECNRRLLNLSEGTSSSVWLSNTSDMVVGQCVAGNTVKSPTKSNFPTNKIFQSQRIAQKTEYVTILRPVF